MKKRTAIAAEAGLLEANGVAGEYHITPQGRDAYGAVDGAFTAALAQMGAPARSAIDSFT